MRLKASFQKGDFPTLERAFLDDLGHGGFPEAQGLDQASRHQLLGNYVDVAILRDVAERHKVANVAGLRWMVRHLLGNDRRGLQRVPAGIAAKTTYEWMLEEPGHLPTS